MEIKSIKVNVCLDSKDVALLERLSKKNSTSIDCYVSAIVLEDLSKQKELINQKKTSHRICKNSKVKANKK